jgi:hypothetical protein
LTTSSVTTAGKYQNTRVSAGMASAFTSSTIQKVQNSDVQDATTETITIINYSNVP